MSCIDLNNEVYELYNKVTILQNTSKKKEKERLLSMFLEDELFVKTVSFLLNPRVTTGLDKKRLSQLCSHEYVETGTLSEMIDYISKNNTGTYESIVSIQSFIRDYYSPDEKLTTFLVDLFSKNLKIGAEAKTVNSVYQKTHNTPLIKIWEVQQGCSIDKYKFKKDEWFSISEKINGCRATYYNGEFVSRQGNVLTGLEHIKKDIDCLNFNYVIDGELRRKNIDNLTDNENFAIGTGIINSDLDKKEEIEFVVFDVIPYDEFDGVPFTTYKNRLKLIDLLRESIKSFGNLKIVPMYYSGTNTSQIDRWLKFTSQNDKEGCVVNRDVPYFRKRHNGCLKVKKFHAMDLEISGFEEGSGKLKGTLGAIVVNYINNTVKVGTGFTDLDRKYIWKNRDNLIGRIAEVKYKDITLDKNTGLKSLQFPTFVRIRELEKCISYD